MAVVVIKVEEEIGPQEMEVIVEDGFVAGQIAPAGTYEDLETHRLVFLPNAGVLPASCNGHVTVYMQKAPTWGEMIDERRASQEKNHHDPARPKLVITECPPPALATPVLAALQKKTRPSTKKKLLAA